MIKKQQKWIALLVTLTFMWLLQVSTMPMAAANAPEQIGSAGAEQGPDYVEAVGHKVAPAKKKSILPIILIGVGVVAVAAVLFLVVLKTKYDLEPDPQQRLLLDHQPAHVRFCRHVQRQRDSHRHRFCRHRPLDRRRQGRQFHHERQQHVFMELYRRFHRQRHLKRHTQLSRRDARHQRHLDRHPHGSRRRAPADRAKRKETGALVPAIAALCFKFPGAGSCLLSKVG
jgi:hypothetical protein